MTSHVFDFVHLTWVGHGPNQAQMAGEYLMGYALCHWPLIIAHCFRIADSWHCSEQILVLLGRKLVIWHEWWLHLSILVDPGPILGHWGA